MSIAGNYLKRFADGSRLINGEPAENLKYIVVIPAYNESGLYRSLDSLFHTHPADAPIEILVVVNWAEGAPVQVKELNTSLYHEYRRRYGNAERSDMRFHFILAGDLPRRFAGAGLARKIGMDEAIRRFEAAGTRDGILFSFDADTLCEPGYFAAIAGHFNTHPDTSGCTIWFEHPLSGTEFKAGVYRAVTYYELHMRYYLRGLRSTGHPNVYHTVGSAFAVRAGDYCRQGGMNRKKAGEDFYFLQKLFDTGQFSECNTTTVFPSPRPSDRVIFGTGPAVSEYLSSHREPLSFNPQSFGFIRTFLDRAGNLYKADEKDYDHFLSEQHTIMREFLRDNNFRIVVNEINGNASTPESFMKRLLRWFNMFRMLKFLNHCKRDFPQIPVTEASRKLLLNEGIETGTVEAEELLVLYRKLERGNRP